MFYYVLIFIYVYCLKSLKVFILYHITLKKKENAFNSFSISQCHSPFLEYAWYRWGIEFTTLRILCQSCSSVSSCNEFIHICIVSTLLLPDFTTGKILAVIGFVIFLNSLFCPVYSSFVMMLHFNILSQVSYYNKHSRNKWD